MRRENRTAEHRLAQIAARQHGNVTKADLFAAGLSEAGIRRRVEKGTLFREYPGVYRVGHRAPSVEARYLAAVLACGKGALLSGRAAAHLHRLTKGPPPPPEVIATTERRVNGIRTRRTRHIDKRDATTVNGIPTTTVPRTLVDLAAVLSPDQLARACHEAGVIYRTTPRQVETVLKRRPNSPGAEKLRQVLRGDVHVTLSKLERAFLELLKREGLQLPETNKRLNGRRLDCRWPQIPLTVELDGYRFHNSRHTWEQDRRREREARKRNDEFRRFTYGDVLEDPRYLLAELRELVPRSSGATRS